MRARGWAVVEGWRDSWRCDLIVEQRDHRDAWALRVYGDTAVAWLAWQSLGADLRNVEMFFDNVPDIRGRAFVSGVLWDDSGEISTTLVGSGALYDEHGDEVTGDTVRKLVYSAQRMSP